MKIFKFGGASVNSAEAVKNVAEILSGFAGEELVVVFSAMGKTTNALEKVAAAAFHQLPELQSRLDEVEAFHLNIAQVLFSDASSPVFEQINKLIQKITDSSKQTDCPFDEFYDRIVSIGELLSTTIVSNYLNDRGIENILIPASEIIKTNDRFRDATPDWIESSATIRIKIAEACQDHGCKIVITQGFIGSAADGRPVTLGREGSDFTASILAFCLDAEEMVVWKDVEGLLNADPACFDETKKIDHISYYDVIELAFFGAKILHPKTIKPLQNKTIPLRIKSFFHPEASGTLIDNYGSGETSIPFFIKKEDQALISFVSKDFSFIAEDKLHRLFGVFNRLNIKINLMQNSAISFSIITNNPQGKLDLLVEELKNDFDIRYNLRLELLTIRNFNDEILENYLMGKTILLEQRSRKTIQVAYLK